jgi:NADPH:quinone reductase-like Zn-dependent oxidoreductase
VPRVPVATDALGELPDGVSATLAATLPLAGLTTVRLLRARPLAGRRVPLTGASGGVGHPVVELAAA